MFSSNYIAQGQMIENHVLSMINLTDSILIEQEENEPNAWDDLSGCRRGKHVFANHKTQDLEFPLFERSGGIQGWCSHSGYILLLEEIDQRETPTQVIVSLFTMLLNTKLIRAYTARICGLGYDMMCCLYSRMRTLIHDEMLTVEQDSLLISLLRCLFVDSFHVKSHRNPLCQNEKDGLFHPHLPKFKGVLWGRPKAKNDSVVEQLWKKTNVLKVARNMGRRQMNVFLHLFRIRHNNRSTKRLIKAGYTRININKVSTLRNLRVLNERLPETNELIELDRHRLLTVPTLI